MKNYLSFIFKAFLTVLFFFTFNINSIYASHSQGGEITMSCLGGNQYELRLALYRDCSGINAPTTVNVRYSSASCGINLNVTLNRIPNTGQEVTALCPGATTVCNGGTLPGVQEYVYTAIVNLPPCSDWVMSYSYVVGMLELILLLDSHLCI